MTLLVSVALLEGVCHYGDWLWGLSYSQTMPNTQYLLLMPADQDVGSQLLQHHACLPNTMYHDEKINKSL